jgi:hypothetical protein
MTTPETETPETESRAWWADVQHLREPAARRREAARERDVAARADPHRAPGASFGDDGGETPSETPMPRRTVQIRGQVIPSVPARRLVEVQRRRAGRGPVDRMVARPDRIALWAVLFGLLLVVVAATSGH